MILTGCVFAFEVCVRAGERKAFHSHNCTELIWVLQGSGNVVTSNQAQPYREGELIVYQPGAKHADRPAEDGLQFCIGIQGTAASCLPAGVWDCGEKPLQTLREIRQLLQEPDTRWKTLDMDILAGELCRRVRRDPAVQQPEMPEGVQDLCERARQKLDTHVNSAYSIDQLGSDVFISKGYLRKLFKERYGESPITYLLRKKLELAEEMLRMTDLPVKEIAAQIGIQNPYYFSTLFQRKKGVSPSSYRHSFRPKK